MSSSVVSAGGGPVKPAACSTSAGKAAQRRPHRNAATLRATATPFSSMARSTAAGDTTTAPDWTATPSSRMLAVVESPNSPVARPAESTKRLWSARDTSASRPVSAPSAGYGVVGWATIAPVGVDATEPMTIVRDVSAPTRCVSLAATRRSNAIRQSTPELLAWFDAGTSPRLRRRSLTTGPAFCDRPVWSRPRTT